MRRYVQRIDSETVYFKSMGDPRLVSALSGTVYEDEEAMIEDEGEEASPATELIYLDLYSPQTEAGMIRWTGWIPGILGNRAAAETNHAFFENHAVPNAMLLISGGYLSSGSVKRIEEGFRARFKGPKNAGKMLIAQATPGKAKSSRNEVVKNPDMEFVNLSDFQRGDALFREYTKMNQDGVASSFRQPPILTGRIPSDLNRATAEAALQQGDDQVYNPQRREFDAWVNDELMFEIGCELIEFESLGPFKRNAKEVTSAGEIGAKYGAFTPNELRQILAKMLGEDLEPLEADWADTPLQMTLAGISADGEQLDDETAEQAVAAIRDLESKLASTQAALREALGFEDGTIPGSPTPHDGPEDGQ
jgi:capsid portal protein